MELLTFIRLFFSSHVAPVAGNLFLRKQPGLFHERKTRPRRTTSSFRFAMVALAKFFGWRDALVMLASSHQTLEGCDTRPSPERRLVDRQPASRGGVGVTSSLDGGEGPTSPEFRDCCGTQPGFPKWYFREKLCELAASS